MPKTAVYQFQQATAFQPGATISLTQASSTPVLPSNANRYQAWISNNSASAVYLYLAATGAGANKGILLPANGQIQFTTYTGAVCAYTASSGVTLAIAEI